MSSEYTKGKDMIAGTFLQWHGQNEVHPVITLRDDKTNPLARWDVEESPLLLPNGKETGFKLLQTTDGFPVGIPFGASYKVFTNHNFLALVESLGSSFDKQGVKWKIVSTGSVRSRNLTFISLEIDQASSFKVDGREFKNFLSVLNSFDKSCRVTVKDSSICVVCSNTFYAALGDDSGAMAVSVTHKRNMVAQLNDVPKMLECAIANRTKMLGKLKEWASFPVGLADAENVFAAWIADGRKGEDLSTRSVNIIERLAYLFAKGKGNKGETALDLFQAVTEYYTHENAGKRETGDDPTKQMESSDFGDGASAKSEFFQTLVGLTESSDKFKGFARVGDTILIAQRKAK